MKSPNPANVAAFRGHLVAAYADLFKTSPEYAYSAARCTPESLADKMIPALVAGSANKNGEGIKRACKAVGIKQTYAALDEYFHAPVTVPTT